MSQDFKNIFDRYLLALRKTAIGDKTEHTDRSALETLLNAFAGEAEGKPKVQHEPKRVAGKGAPDFKIGRRGLILGYVENKAIGENLDKVLKSDQIGKYKELSNNIVLTDYLQFIWIGKDGIRRETLCHESDLENRKFKVRDDRIAAVAKLLQGFFSTAPEGIGKSQQLALALAARSKLLKDYLGEELVRQEREHQEGRLYGLYKTFRDQVFHELTLGEFADAFAQMLAYGLFLARLNADAGTTITLSNARDHIPGSFQLIHELVEFLTELNKKEYTDVKWVVEEVLSIVNGLDLASIHEDLSFRQRRAISRKVRAQDEEEHRLFERDPFIYFYEGYLKAYDAATRKSRGVYYTPPPIVNFIVRAVDDILKDSFGIKQGLADSQRVTVLDFACGTGTFLLEVFQRIFDNIGGAEAGKADKVVSDHILRNIYGFEYLIAPYTIAHLKLSQYLRDKGHPLKNDERLQVFLTNTLEPIKPQANLLLPAITEEAKEAQAVKEKPILVITGNPPYSGHSKNKGEWISAAIDGYKFTIETDEEGREIKKPLGERNPKWLNDDYVKFIRFAQLKMDAVEEGIVGIITNHSWLDNPTFRGMRQSLMRSFEQIYVLDLHGNAKKKERAPDGSKDENVFDIEQGVAISIFVKQPELERNIWRGDIWGKRLTKYRATIEQNLEATVQFPLNPAHPFYLFTDENVSERTQHNKLLSLREIFDLSGTGIITKRDKLTVHFTSSEVWDVVEQFVRTPDHELHRVFHLVDDVRDWKAIWAKKDLIASGPNRSLVQKITYRPFDERFTYNTGNSRGFLGWPVPKLMRHMVSGNIALITARTNKSPYPDHFFVTQFPAETKAGESTVQSYNFPLFVTGEGRGLVENFSPAFRSFLDTRYEHHYEPEEILGYIYAVLYAPAYRARYAEFLRIDFPRIPFAEKRADFDALSDLGAELVQAHLLKAYPDAGLAEYHGKGDHEVEAVRYSENEKTVWINKTQCFKPMPPNVWEFHIGGYPVLEKYLKSRKGRKLSLEEIDHVAAIASSLAFTIAQMAKIDRAYNKAFSDRG